MSLKMGIQTAIHIASLQLRQLHSPGWVQYRIALHYQPLNQSQKIYFMAQNIDNTMRIVHQRHNQPQIDSYCCYSQKYQVEYLNAAIRDETTYYFKAYMDLTLIQKVELYVTVDLLFGNTLKSTFAVLHSFQAKINSCKDVFEYLPVCFDHYGTLTLQGTLHSALMEFKFQKNQDESALLKKQYPNFYYYLQTNTKNYKPQEITAFYSSYRQPLESQLANIQQRFNNASKALLNHPKKTAYSRISQSKKLFQVIRKIESSKAMLTQEDKKEIGQIILQDILNIKALIYQNWNQFNELIKMNSERMVRKLKRKYDMRVRERIQSNIVTQYIKYHDWTFNKYDKNSQNHLEQVRSQKKIHIQNKWEILFPIQDIKLFPPLDQPLKIFLEHYDTGNLPKAQPVPDSHEHLVFLVHGFQAHRNDLLGLKLCLQANHKVKVHISCANIDKTEDSIDLMGKRLAAEVHRFIQIIKKSYKVSFIGHSMGGLIIRSSLQYLPYLSEHLHAFISLGSPHLGYLYQSSALVQAGLWFMNNFDKCDSLLQLTMQDHPNKRQTFLYQLSKQTCFNKFKKISFVASSQDQYVPYCSARAQKSANCLTQELKKEEREVVCEMVDNMLCSVQASEINRIDVIFNIEPNFDSFIGKTGHIKFLCDPHFLKHFSLGMDQLLL